MCFCGRRARAPVVGTSVVSAHRTQLTSARRVAGRTAQTHRHTDHTQDKRHAHVGWHATPSALRTARPSTAQRRGCCAGRPTAGQMTTGRGRLPLTSSHRARPRPRRIRRHRTRVCTPHNTINTSPRRSPCAAGDTAPGAAPRTLPVAQSLPCCRFMMRSSISGRKARMRPWTGHAAASPRAQMVWPSIW